VDRDPQLREGVVEIDNEDLGDGLTVDASATSCSTDTRIYFGSTGYGGREYQCDGRCSPAADVAHPRPRRHRDLFWAC
jgi:hypothetical protein